MDQPQTTMPRIASGLFHLAIAEALARADTTGDLTRDEEEWVRYPRSPAALPPTPPPGSVYETTVLNGGVKLELSCAARPGIDRWIYENPEVLVVYWETLGERIKTSPHPVLRFVAEEYKDVIHFLDKELVLPYL